MILTDFAAVVSFRFAVLTNGAARIRPQVGTINWHSLILPGGAGRLEYPKTFAVGYGGFFVGQNQQTINDQDEPPQIIRQAWTETYRGGSAEAEYAEFQMLATEIMQVQLKNQKRASAGGHPQHLDRAFHAKPTLVVNAAKLRFCSDLPVELQSGFARPGAEYRTSVRFSNASGERHNDLDKDLRGVALRVLVNDEEQHDLLMTNFPVSHARDARQFVTFAKATAGGNISKAAGVVKLIATYGVRETWRMLRNISDARTVVDSIATETYWSRGAIRWGATLAVRYLLRPVDDRPRRPEPDRTDPNYLSREVSARLKNDDLVFELCIQRFTDERTTPIEDTAIPWPADHSLITPVAELTISKGDRGATEEGLAAAASAPVNYNPWNTTDEFRPLGNLNRARKSSYDASADLRNELRWHTDPPLRNVVLAGGARAFFTLLNRRWPWYRIGVKPGLINIVALRQTLQRKNRFDTELPEAPPIARAVPDPPPEQARTHRSVDGSSNDLSAPAMGAVGATFGRNLRPDYQQNDPGRAPSPVVISQELLYRRAFRPAPSLNVLAAAWIQFQIHDWVDHARYPLDGTHDVEVPLPDGRTWTSLIGRSAGPSMRIAGNKGIPGLGSSSIRPLSGETPPSSMETAADSSRAAERPHARTGRRVSAARSLAVAANRVHRGVVAWPRADCIPCLPANTMCCAKNCGRTTKV